MMAHLVELLKGQKGASAVEYGLVVALIALAIVAAATALGGQLSTLFNQIVTTLAGA